MMSEYFIDNQQYICFIHSLRTLLGLLVFFCCLPLISPAQKVDSAQVELPVDQQYPNRILNLQLSDRTYQKGRYDLSPYLYILPDTTGAWTIETVSAISWASRFRLGRTSEISQQQPDVAYYWLRLTIQSQLERDEEWLAHLAQPEVILFEQEESGQFSRRLSGSAIPYQDRFSGDRYGHFSLLPLHIKKGLTQTWYWKVKAGEVWGGPYWQSTNQALLAPHFLMRFEAKQRLSTGLIYGIFLTVVLYHLILFFYNQKKTFLYFALFVFFNLILAFYFDTFFLEYFFLETPWINGKYLFYTCILGFIVFLILFTRSYLQLDRYIPLGDRVLKVLLIAHVSFCLGMLLLLGFSSNFFESYYLPITKLYTFSLSLLFIFILILSIISWRRGAPRSTTFILAIGINILQQIINTLHASGIIEMPQYILGDNGVALGIIIFTIGLGKQFRDIQEANIIAETNRKKEQEEAERLRGLDKFKSRFYANITHEFRTPLTIIKGLVDQLGDKVQQNQKEKIHLIQQNSDHILQLINQLLDLTKLEAGRLELHYVQGNIISYLEYLTESFHSIALSRNITLSFHTHTAELIMDYEPQRCQEVLSNLISNAIKFTPEYGKIKVVAKVISEEQQNLLEVSVTNSGTGIPAAQLPYVFDRFYQGNAAGVRTVEGTGIGLALVKELINLMEGTIRVDDQVEEGARFVFCLPVRHTAEKITGLEELPTKIAPKYTNVMGEEPVLAAAQQQGPELLVVEDNRDVIYYLRECLRGRYQITTAHNGQEGINYALEHIPDLVISDIMMPGVNGFELCRKLKTDERTSHIPIILLTAKVEHEDKMEGLSLGADAYLAKPFLKDELLIRIEKLIELRARLQESYQQGIGGVAEKEAPFVQKLRSIVMDHLDDVDFGVMQLSRALGMSRVQVHRKLKALTGLSTSELIRLIRLQRAYQLLQDSQWNVSEVAYQVGYKDPAHFSRAFSQQFGKPPREMLR